MFEEAIETLTLKLLKTDVGRDKMCDLLLPGDLNTSLIIIVLHLIFFSAYKSPSDVRKLETNNRIKGKISLQFNVYMSEINM